MADVRMPGLNGIELQEDLIRRRREEQVVFITGPDDIPMCAQAMESRGGRFSAETVSN